MFACFCYFIIFIFIYYGFCQNNYNLLLLFRLLTANEEPTSSVEKVKRKRGPTTMPRVVKARSHGEVKEVTYNRRGQSLGEVNMEMQSYLGVITRTTVPINFKNWFSVLEELKNKIWIQIKVIFFLIFLIEF